MDGDELGGGVIVGERDNDGVFGDVEGGTKPQDDAQKGPCWDSCGVS